MSDVFGGQDYFHCERAAASRCYAILTHRPYPSDTTLTLPLPYPTLTNHPHPSSSPTITSPTTHTYHHPCPSHLTLPTLIHHPRLPFLIDCCSPELIGVRKYGVHINGYFYTEDGSLVMWIGKRSILKPKYPGLLDNIVCVILISCIHVCVCMYVCVLYV